MSKKLFAQFTKISILEKLLLAFLIIFCIDDLFERSAEHVMIFEFGLSFLIIFFIFSSCFEFLPVRNRLHP